MRMQHEGPHGRNLHDSMCLPGQVRLRDLGPGDQAVVAGYAPGNNSYRSKLLSMGLTRGTIITVRNIAPLGDPVHISVHDFEMSLRRDEADALLLVRSDDGGPDFRPHTGRGRGMGPGLGMGPGRGRGLGPGGGMGRHLFGGRRRPRRDARSNGGE